MSGTRAEQVSDRRAGLLVWAPAVLILVPLVLSGAAWLLPTQTSGLTGFVSRGSVDPRGTTLIALWVLAAIVATTVGASIAVRQGPISSLARVSLAEWHGVCLVLGVAGTLWVYWSVTGGSVAALVEIWRAQDFNRFAEDFDYGVGLATARYAAVIAGGLSIAHVLTGRRTRLIDAASIVTLIGVVLLSSRISALMAISVAAATLMLGPGFSAVKPVRLAVAIVVLLGLFVVANYSRNAQTYEAAGIRDPVVMAGLNAQAYLATPAQVTVTVTAAAMDDVLKPPGGAMRALGPVLPVFLQKRVAPEIEVVKDVAGNVETRYQGTVDLTKSYTTNGVIPDLLASFGWLALLSAIAMFGVAAWIAGRFGLSGPVGATVAGAALYGFAETWRVYMFNQGSVVFLLLLGAAAAVVGAARSERSARRPADTLRSRRVGASGNSPNG